MQLNISAARPTFKVAGPPTRPDQPRSRPEQDLEPVVGQDKPMLTQAIREFLGSSAIWWWISTLIVGVWAFVMAQLLL